MTEKVIEVNEAGRVGASVDVVADYLGLTARRVQQLEKSRGNLRWARGLYDLQGFVRSYCDYLRADDRNSASKERTRLLTAQAEKTEIEVDEKKGELISAAAVEKHDRKIADIFKNNLLSLADRQAAYIAAESDPRKVHRILTEESIRILNGVMAGLRAEVDESALDITRANAHKMLNEVDQVVAGADE